MRLIRNAGSAMRRFVLGDLAEQSRLELEERLITDPTAFDTLGVVEEELADAYVDGELTAAETEGFERTYLVDQDRRRHIALIRLLKSCAAVAPGRPVSSGRRRIGEVISLYPWSSSAAAAVFLLLVGGNLWFATVHSRLQGQFDQVRAQKGQEEQRRQELQREIVRLTVETTTLQARLESQGATAGELPTFALTAGVLRGPGTPPVRIAIPAGARFVRLELRLPGDGAPPFRAVLYDADGSQIWFQAKLAAESVGGRAVVPVLLPAQLLPRGDYQIRLSRVETSGRRNSLVPGSEGLESVATYALRVGPSQNP